MNYLLSPAKLFCTILVGLNIFISFGQNLVLNPSFEDAVTVQCDPHSNINTFAASAPNWTSPSEATPDVFSALLNQNCPMNPFTTSFLNFGQQAPRTGNKMGGFIGVNEGFICTNYREYLQGTLASALVVGQPYEIEFYLNLGESSNKATNNIGIKFTIGLLNFPTSCTIPLTPDLVETSVISDIDNWVRISFCYVPTEAGLTNFIIGNFYDNPLNMYTSMPGLENTAYYFIDDVSVKPLEVVEPEITELTVDICENTAYNLYDLISPTGTIPTNGFWTGQSQLENGYLGTFNTSTNVVGTYVYTWNGDSDCAGVSSIAITLNNASGGLLEVEPVVPMCTTAESVNLVASIQGGTWSGNGVIENTFDPSLAGEGTHEVTYSVIGACAVQQTIEIVVSSAPILNPVINVSQGCTPLIVNFSSELQQGASNEWLISNVVQQTNTANFTDTIDAVGCFDVVYTESWNGCTASVVLTDAICVGAQPEANFTSTLTLQEVHQSHFNLNNLSANANDYLWTYAPIGASQLVHPIITIPVEMQDVEVCLIASNNSCTDTICKLIRAEEMLVFYVPNSFTPDGNESNQTFLPIFSSGVDVFDYTMMIFNRWGQIVFETRDVNVGWNGTLNGIPAQDGTYTYRIEFKALASDERKVVVGHVNLLK